MKPAPFAYHAPHTLDEALALLAEHGDARPLAGGQSLIPAMNFRLARPAALVDLGGVAELRYVREEGGVLVVGAMTSHAALERSDAVARLAPLVSEAIPHVAHPQIRNRGTVGGSLAHADPAAELPAVMVASEARLLLRGRAGERWLPAERFFVGLFATALVPGELLVAVELPAPAPRTGWAFAEVARRHGDYALVGVAASLTLDAEGRCARARIVLLSVGDGPTLAVRAAQALQGREPTDAAVRAAGDVAAHEDIDPPADIHASAAYRRQLAGVLTRRALTRAVARARGAPGSAS